MVWHLAYQKVSGTAIKGWEYEELPGLDDLGMIDQAQEAGQQVWSAIKAGSGSRAAAAWYSVTDPHIVWMVPLKETGD